MKIEIKKVLWPSLITSLVVLLLGILLLFKSTATLVSISYIIGGILIAIGVIGIIRFFSNRSSDIFQQITIVYGIISILGYSTNSNIVLIIVDDGIGMKKDKLNLLLSNNLSSEKGSGYGLKNINKRIKLLYGENYGLSFESNYGYGTKVKITIPKIEKTDKTF